MASNSTPRTAIRPGIRRLFRAAILIVIAAAGLIGAEAILRRQQREIARSNRTDPGMVKYDPLLGWRLQPNWKGAHHHHDFSARYSIGPRGLRSDTPDVPRNSGRKLALALGDSYTFGFGVNDDETFVHHLNAEAAAGFDYLNAGTPGYSTDQEMLLLDKELWALGPQRVLLFVYVGNDVLDNQLEIPLQLRSPKPRFEVIDGGLVLRNVPVPVKNDVRVQPWMSVVLDPDPSQWSWRTRLDLRYELFRLASPPYPAERDHRPEFATRFESALTLFERLVTTMANNCIQKRAELMVVLLASETYFRNPKSVSAQYQDFFCEQIAERLRNKPIPVIHLPALMRSRFQHASGRWFFPHDGHYTALGNKLIAEILATELKRAESGSPR